MSEPSPHPFVLLDVEGNMIYIILYIEADGSKWNSTSAFKTREAAEKYAMSFVEGHPGVRFEIDSCRVWED